MICILDASALLAFLRNETGADDVENLLLNPENICYSHSVNLCEVFYDTPRQGESVAQSAIQQIRLAGILPREDMDSRFWQAVARFKVDPGRISLADCFLLALAQRMDGEVVTADHHEMDRLATMGILPFRFIR